MNYVKLTQEQKNIKIDFIDGNIKNQITQLMGQY